MKELEKYNDYISKLADVYGKCAEITLEMQKEFPELIRVRGHYYCLWWGQREHWWLKTIDDTIVDPTAKQFPSNGIGRYVEHAEGTEEPTGKCPNCGEYCYKGNYLCSDHCEKSYRAYLMGDSL